MIIKDYCPPQTNVCKYSTVNLSMVVKYGEIAQMFPFPYLADYGGNLHRRSLEVGIRGYL